MEVESASEEALEDEEDEEMITGHLDKYLTALELEIDSLEKSVLKEKKERMDQLNQRKIELEHMLKGEEEALKQGFLALPVEELLPHWKTVRELEEKGATRVGRFVLSLVPGWRRDKIYISSLAPKPPKFIGVATVRKNEVTGAFKFGTRTYCWECAIKRNIAGIMEAAQVVYTWQLYRNSERMRRYVRLKDELEKLEDELEKQQRQDVDIPVLKKIKEIKDYFDALLGEIKRAGLEMLRIKDELESISAAPPLTPSSTLINDYQNFSRALHRLVYTVLRVRKVDPDLKELASEILDQLEHARYEELCGGVRLLLKWLGDQEIIKPKFYSPVEQLFKRIEDALLSGRLADELEAHRSRGVYLRRLHDLKENYWRTHVSLEQAIEETCLYALEKPEIGRIWFKWKDMIKVKG